MRRNARIIVNVASCGLFLVFVALIVFAALGVQSIRYAADRTLLDDALSHRYEYVERELWKEASLVRVHGLNPQGSEWNANIEAERNAADVIESSLNAIESSGNADDRILARDVLADHDTYTDMLHVLFAEIDASAPQASQTFAQSTRLFDKMQVRIDRRASEQHDAAIASLTQLARTERYVVRAISLGAALAGILLVAAAFLIVRYRRVIEASRTSELDRLTAASLTDTLTGLGNHKAYQDELARDLSLLQRRGGVVSLALIDVDEFKRINDTKGHIFGDHVLAALADLIGGLRPSDRGFRLGGDEFAVILPYTDSAQALGAMERLREQVAASLEGTTISVGIASTRGNDLDAVTLRSQADIALYDAKHHGRDSVVAYSVARSRPNAPPAQAEVMNDRATPIAALSVTAQPSSLVESQINPREVPLIS